jgi:hypothetical protein
MISNVKIEQFRLEKGKSPLAESSKEIIPFLLNESRVAFSFDCNDWSLWLEWNRFWVLQKGPRYVVGICYQGKLISIFTLSVELIEELQQIDPIIADWKEVVPSQVCEALMKALLDFATFADSRKLRESSVRKAFTTKLNAVIFVEFNISPIKVRSEKLKNYQI